MRGKWGQVQFYDFFGLPGRRESKVIVVPEKQLPPPHTTIEHVVNVAGGSMAGGAWHTQKLHNTPSLSRIGPVPVSPLGSETASTCGCRGYRTATTAAIPPELVLWRGGRMSAAEPVDGRRQRDELMVLFGFVLGGAVALSGAMPIARFGRC